jgi:hypothetical protein
MTEAGRYTAVHNPSFRSLFTPIETMLYFFKRLRIFLGIGHPISENQCSHHNFQKDCVRSFPTCKTFAVFCTSFPVGTMTSRLNDTVGQVLTSPYSCGNFGVPQVRTFSFARFLMHLLLQLSLECVSDFTMMCLPIQPHSLVSGSCLVYPERSRRVSTKVCSRYLLIIQSQITFIPHFTISNLAAY